MSSNVPPHKLPSREFPEIAFDKGTRGENAYTSLNSTNIPLLVAPFEWDLNTCTVPMSEVDTCVTINTNLQSLSNPFDWDQNTGSKREELLLEKVEETCIHLNTKLQPHSPSSDGDPIPGGDSGAGMAAGGNPLSDNGLNDASNDSLQADPDDARNNTGNPGDDSDCEVEAKYISLNTSKRPPHIPRC